jgi:acyl-CoA synthetase (AMP-forming)/AMP-acid ligase II
MYPPNRVPAGFVSRLGEGWPEDGNARPALVTETGTVTHAEVRRRVMAATERLGPRRRLVLLAGRNHPEAVILYLAALHGRHPLILADAGNPGALSALIRTYDPDVVARPADGDPDRWEIVERRPGTRHELHPDLALLLSTSGSTGSPKLVRLSLASLEANAEAIGEYLGIRETDRAITSLPLTYCYGLSVVNSHLARGASVVLTEDSVIDPAFWRLFETSEATSFAGVPYTFDLLDRVGFANMTLPHLRTVTQAGGRMDPETVRRHAELGRRNGWELFVMYGQTEATARMAYLPSAMAANRPESIGMPIPGGSLRVDPIPGAPPGTGELVYRGPNVMLGYANGPTDLALGRTTDELRTGDLGRQGSDGLFEIVGRRADFLKIAGLRVDLRGVERLVARLGVRAGAVGIDDALVVVIEPDAPAHLHPAIRDAIGLPSSAVRVVTVPELPRLPSGKLDRGALRDLAAASDAPGMPGHTPGGLAAVRDLYEKSLGLEDVADSDTFAGRGGDSLSYIEVTLGLEEILGRLPDGWASLSIGELGAMAPATDRPARWWTPLTRWRSIDTSVALRALAILLVVGTHIGMIAAPGGAHVLMAVAGYNFARFRLTAADRTDRLRAQLHAVARIALPAMAWVAAVLLLTDQYEIRHMLLINALVRDELWGNLWFIELLVYIGLAMAALLAVPAVDRAERRWPFGLALAVLGIGLLFRFELVDFGVPYTMPVLWLFALGWAASRAEGWWQRGLVLGIGLLSVPGYFESFERNALIAFGIGLLVCVRRVRVPGGVARAAGVLAAASLYIYLVHWEVWPLFQGWYGLPSLGASLAAGVALWLAASRAPAALDRLGRWAAEETGPPSTLFRRPSEWRLQ